MSTPMIVGILAISMLILVAIAVIMQTIEKNKKQRKLLENNLRTRARNFEHMQEVFPEGFLNRDLLILLANCKLDVYEQLLNTSPSNSSYKNQAQHIKQQLEQLKQLSGTHSPIRLTDAKKIPEIQKMLNSFFQSISKWADSGRINSKDAIVYGGHIRRLLLQTTTDGLEQAVSNAKNQGKFKLALHNLQMAIDKVEKANTKGEYNEKIQAYQSQMKEIKQEANIADEERTQRREQSDEQWEAETKPDESWKKNRVYD